MGVYTEYLDKQMDFEALTKERKKQLERIATIRKRALLVFAADVNKGQAGAPISIDYSDLLPFNDQLSNLQGKAVDVIIETPGGDGSVAEDLVRRLHDKFEEVAFIIPGYAKSAGTIIAMAGDEILMGPTSALGPIDAQLFWQGKVFSAEALLEGMEKIKKEVAATNTLNKAYIPVLQGISPGELQSAQNALDFARRLVTDWLVKYKFKNWKVRKTSGESVTEEYKKQRAEEIASNLAKHSQWLTHSRSIRMEDLVAMGLQITDYTKEPKLADAVQRFHVLLQMTFDTNIYKVIETPTSQIYRFFTPQIAAPAPTLPGGATNVIFKVKCGRCGAEVEIQANLEKAQPIQPGKRPFPANNKLKCPSCSNDMDLSDARRQIEAQTKKKIVT